MAEQPAPPTAATLSKLIEHSRGLHLGAVLGDAWAELSGGTELAVPGGVLSQLLLATSEGLIRSLERMGQGLDPAIPHETVQSLRRWAWQQGIDDVEEGRDNSPGLLWHVDVLGERRGSAPATVRALVGGPLAVHGPGHQSLGAHAAVRPLPFALLAATHGPDRLVLAAENASITHGHPLAAASARSAATMAWTMTWDTDSVPKAMNDMLAGMPDIPGLTDRIGAAVTEAVTNPGSMSTRNKLVADSSAPSVLTGAAYCVASHWGPDEVPLALRVAAHGRQGRAVAALTGALLGIRHGSTALVTAGVARVETAWAAEALATDLAMTLLLTPLAVQPDGTQWLPGWSHRYPAGQE